MSILDKVKDMAGGLAGGEGGSNMLSQVMNMIGGNFGGLQGLVNQFQNAGLNDIVQSWVSTGENKAISPDQIQSALGDNITGIAAKLGLSTSDVASQLSNVLPQVVDKLTPNGTIPEGNVLDQGMDAVKKLFGG
jgi:uncharacterized protein YidB (DUF937 family)